MCISEALMLSLFPIVQYSSLITGSRCAFVAIRARHLLALGAISASGLLEMRE